jgi:hypothetical protein
MSSMNDDGDEEYKGEAQADEFVSGDEEIEPEGELLWMSEEYPPETAAQFWLSVAAYEQAPWTTHFQELSDAGVELPAPESMDDRQLAAKLSEVIDALARMRVFLSQTDHLSDRELYALLWGDTLREPVKNVPFDESSAWHIDLLSGGGEEETRLYMKHYADEETRRRWLAEFPDDEMPPHEELPYDRDRRLPQAQSRTELDESDELM